MEVILSQDVTKLGSVGAVLKVKDGYARNYLIPNKLACKATPSNLRQIEKRQKMQQAQDDEKKNEAEALAEKLSKISPTVNVEVNDLDKLYGAISETEIISAIEVEGHEVDKKDLVIEKPIEELGIFEIGVTLHPEVTAKIRLWVTKK
jgi:large subunit ribosomal protein L9